MSVCGSEIDGLDDGEVMPVDLGKRLYAIAENKPSQLRRGPKYDCDLLFSAS